MPKHIGGRSSLLSVTAWLSGIRPPPPTICDSPTGPFVTSLRIKLEDGRHLAYKEHGVPKEEAKYKIIFIHGSNSCRHDMPAPSPELVQELGIYLLSFDRAGYGESDPNPRRTEKTTALDVAELADQLNLGPKFYVIGHSMGGQAVWGCLKYIPHRLSGAVLLCPVVNYWWQSFPAKLVREAYNEQLLRDRWALGVAHYVPWLTYWWNTQRWFPSSSVAAGIPDVLSPDDKVLASIRFPARHQDQKHAKQQGEFETIHRDIMVGFGTWEFDPMELENPFPTGDGAVHLWHGDEDRLVPTSLQRHIARRLPWIRYHELPGRGHLFHIADGMFDNILRALLKETL
ncbi:unnamed protein product [Spirodela intermedia]|uniref:AB hydrolase-1 domain-containing protein n=1 Tax=Spirodela intermedia TaxID=51605 RepID=A0A7I8J7P5_SPIIN|nr:unnamed protein product [Spirodela intermedia]CAA6665433.1 unnamed protein product [Spirodela intermedia]